MSLTSPAQVQVTSPAAAARRFTTRSWPELNNPAAWVVALILLIMQLIANGFILIEIFGTTIIPTPQFLSVDWRSDIPFYYVVLAAAALCYLAVEYLSRAPFGLALQGVRDNPRRMAALGFNVNAHRVAAYAFASFVASLAGILQVWNYRQISPGSVGVEGCIDILIIAIVGGITRPVGPFIGALIFVILRTFALDFLVKIGLDGNRFRLLIGLGFLAVVFWSSDGMIGLWERWRRRNRSGAMRARGTPGHG